MMTLSREPTKAPTPRDAAPFVRISRITFTDEKTGAGRRRFSQPRCASALEEDVSIESVATANHPPEAVGHCFIACIPEGSSVQNRERARALFAGAERAETPAITVEHGSEVLE